MFTGHSSYSYGFNNPVMFGDPSGLAPEPIQKGGGTADVLLGSGTLAQVLGEYANTVTGFSNYYETIPYVETYVGFTEGFDYLCSLCLEQEKQRVKYEIKYITEGGGGGPSLAFGQGGARSGSSGNDNGSTDFGYWDDSNINPDGWYRPIVEFVGNHEQGDLERTIPTDNYPINNVFTGAYMNGEEVALGFSLKQKLNIRDALQFLKNSPTFKRMYEYIISTTIPVTIYPSLEVGVAGTADPIEANRLPGYAAIHRCIVNLSWDGIEDKVYFKKSPNLFLSLVETLAHEFVHIWQFLTPRGEKPSSTENADRSAKIGAGRNTSIERHARYKTEIIMNELLRH